LQVAFSLVQRDEVELQELEADWRQTAHIELLASDFLSEELPDLPEVKDGRLGGLRFTRALAPREKFLLVRRDAGLGDQKVVYDPELFL